MTMWLVDGRDVIAANSNGGRGIRTPKSFRTAVFKFPGAILQALRSARYRARKDDTTAHVCVLMHPFAPVSRDTLSDMVVNPGAGPW